jgi:glycosyltransferase 2 family protein
LSKPGGRAKGYRRGCRAQGCDTIERPTDVNWRRALRGVLLVASIGLALHLVLPQIPGLERSLRLIVGTSHLLVGAAFVAEVLSELSYAELLGRSVGTIARTRYSSRVRRRRGMERWFMLRLTLTGYGVSHVFPGGGAVATTMTYRVLRHRGLDSEKVGLALAAVSVLVYGALGVLLAGSLAYMFVMGDLGPVLKTSSTLLLVLTLGGALFAYATYREPTLARSVVSSAVRRIGRFLPDRKLQPALEKAERRSAEFVSRLGEAFRAAHRHMTGRPREALIFSALGFGYWAFDALCLILMFEAMGVPASPLVLLVAYGVATSIATIPLTPGGIGVFETTMLATLVLLGVGSEAAIPILGYRLFNFWLPIPLAAIFYPTLRLGAGAGSSTR